MAEQEAIFAPILRSERLTLTLYEENRDLQAVVDLMNTLGKASPDPTTFVHTKASTRQLLKNTVLSPENCAGLRATTHLSYAIHLGSESGPFIGVVGIFERHPAIAPDIGFVLFAQYQRQGFGVEAGRRFLSYLQDELRIKDISAVCLPTNELSKKCISRLGFVEGGEVLIDWKVPACAYVLPGMKHFGNGVVGFKRWGEEKQGGCCDVRSWKDCSSG